MFFRNQTGSCRRPAWEEAYLERKIREFAALLAGSEKASDKFFALGKKIEKDQRQLYVVLRDSRSCMYMNILALLERKVITPEDLDGFSERLQRTTSGNSITCIQTMRMANGRGKIPGRFTSAEKPLKS